MAKTTEKALLNSIKAKVIAALLFGGVAFGLFWSLSQNAFSKILGSVEKISAPNPRLLVLNSLYSEITTLDHAGENPANPAKNSIAFISESQRLKNKIDTLRALSAANSYQQTLLDSMENILFSREKHFLVYLKARAQFFSPGLLRQVDELSALIEQSGQQVDSNVKKTRLKETRTTRLVQDTIETREPGIVGWLFGKKKKEIKYVPETTLEHETIIDTLTTARQDSSIYRLGEAMRDIEKNRYRQSVLLLNKELELMRVNKQLVRQFLLLLDAVKNDEMKLMAAANKEASETVGAGLNKIVAVSVFFFVMLAAVAYLIFNDISKSNKYRRELIAAKAEAERLGQVKQRFLANMSHEIRTPLQSILGYAEQLKQTTGEKAVEAIYQSSEYLHQIVNEILDYSKITAGKYTLEKAPFNCIAIINNVADAARAQALKKELEFTVNIQPDLNPCLVGDAFRLKQVLFNLLGNAIKFTEHGSVRLDVLQEIKGSQATLRFSIADTGPGIAQADIDTIFNLFEQGSSPAGKQAGTGLGLSIVKELVQLQGGSVKVDSRIGEGSVFTFVLPYTLAQAASSQPADANALPAATGTGKILFVDDDPLILELCRTILEKHTITGVYRHQPEEILNAPWDDSVVTAFLDMRMPKINGAQLCAFIKQQAPPGTKVYALTAQALPNEREAILNQGFDGIIIKPFKEDQLLRFIGNNAVAEAPGHSENDFWLLQRMTGGDPERMKSILRLYLEETAVEIALLDGYKQGKNIAVITEALHKLAGRIGQVGATELAKQLRLQERKLGSMPGKLVFDELDLLAGEVRAFNEKVLQYVEAGTPVYTETRY